MKPIPTRRIENALRINPTAVERKLVAFIEKRVKGAGADGVVVGVSGGIDSSVVACVCAKALGSKKILGISMPESSITNPHDVADARDITNKLGVGFRVIDIAPIVYTMRQNLPGYKIGAPIPAANIRPRLRMAVLYYYANLLNRLVVGSGNRSELRAGYFTKYGDGAADLLPLGGLYKTQVKKLAEHLGLPKRIINKVPSAGLWRGQTDEGELGISYEKLDVIYAGLDLKMTPNVIAKAADIGVEKVKHFIERERKVSHKLRVPDIPKL